MAVSYRARARDVRPLRQAGTPLVMTTHSTHLLSCRAHSRSSHVLQESSSSTDAAMADLEKRIASLEVGKGYDATKEAVQKVEKEFLIKFREIKAALESEAGTKANSKEMEALRAENALLKQKNAKLEYRVQHCVESMEKMYKFVEN